MAKQKKFTPPRDSWEARKERERELLASVGIRKVKIEDLEREAKERELEREANDLLRKADHDLLVALAENVEALRQGMEQLKLPSNDPHYLARLQGVEAARAAIANRLTQIDLVPDGAKTYIGVGSFTHSEARELGMWLSGHFECKIRQHE